MPTCAEPILTQEQALAAARRAADKVSKDSNHPPIPPEELRQIAYVEALRILRNDPTTEATRHSRFMHLRCREACIRAIRKEQRRARDQQEATESIQRNIQSITRAHSWAYVRREPIPDPAHVTCYVWSFRIAGGTPGYLRRAIDALPPQQREAVHMVFLQGMTQDAAAARLGVSQQSVSERLYRAIRVLKKKLCN